MPKLGLYHDADVILLTSNTGAVTRSAAGNIHVRKDNLTGVAAPDVSDDSSVDYEVGSTWLDTVGGNFYVCKDATQGAAVWLATVQNPVSPGGDDTQVQFNNAGAFGGSANLTWSGTTLAVTGAETITSEAAGTIPLAITAANGQTANLLNVTSFGGTDGDLFKIAANGVVTILARSGGNSAAGLIIKPNAVTSPNNGLQIVAVGPWSQPTIYNTAHGPGDGGYIAFGNFISLGRANTEYLNIAGSAVITAKYPFVIANSQTAGVVLSATGANGQTADIFQFTTYGQTAGNALKLDVNKDLWLGRRFYTGGDTYFWSQYQNSLSITISGHEKMFFGVNDTMICPSGSGGSFYVQNTNTSGTVVFRVKVATDPTNGRKIYSYAPMVTENCDPAQVGLSIIGANSQSAYLLSISAYGRTDGNLMSVNTSGTINCAGWLTCGGDITVHGDRFRLTAAGGGGSCEITYGGSPLSWLRFIGNGSTTVPAFKIGTSLLEVKNCNDTAYMAVGMGNLTVNGLASVVSTTEQLRLSYDANNYLSSTVSSAGAVTLDAVGASAGFTFSDNVTVNPATGHANVTIQNGTSGWANLILRSGYSANTDSYSVLKFDGTFLPNHYYQLYAYRGYNRLILAETVDATTYNVLDLYNGDLILGSQDQLTLYAAGGVALTGVMSFPAGTAGAPSITFTGDLDTGIYSPAANQLSIAYSGGEAWNFNGTGGMNSFVTAVQSSSIGNSNSTGRLIITGYHPNWAVGPALELHASNGAYRKGGFQLYGGTQDADRAPAFCGVSGMNALASASTNQNGGDLKLYGGNAASAAAKTGVGGNVYIYGGAKSPSGTDGNVYLNYDGSAERGNAIVYGLMGLGTGTTVSAKLHVVSTTEQLRLGYDASNYASFTTGSTGILTVKPTGGQFILRNPGSTSTTLNIYQDYDVSPNGYSTLKFSGSMYGDDRSYSLYALRGYNTLTLSNTHIGTTHIVLTLYDGLLVLGATSQISLPKTGGINLNAAVNVKSTTSPQLTVKYDDSNYVTTTVASSGYTTFEVTGSSPGFRFKNNVRCDGQLTIQEGGSTPVYLTIFEGSDQSTNITYYLPAAQAAGSGYLLSNNGSGVLSWVAATASQWTTSGSDIYYDTGKVGVGTGATVSAKLHSISTTEPLRIGYDATAYAKFVVNSSGRLDITNVSGSAGAHIYLNPQSNYVYISGTSTARCVVLDAPGSQSWGEYSGDRWNLVSGLATAHSVNVTTGVVFNEMGANLDFRIEGDTNVNMFVVDASADMIGIGTAEPAAQLHILKATEQLRLGYNTSNYTSFTTNSGGDLTITPSGGNLTIATADVDLASDKAYYLGAPGTDGTWRIVRSGNNLLLQRREAGSYVTKTTITA